MPDGKPLTLMMGSAPTGENRIRDELWLKNMRGIGVRIEFVKQKWPDLLKMARAGQLQMWQVGWITTSARRRVHGASYGPNGGETNTRVFGTRSTTSSSGSRARARTAPSATSSTRG